MSGLNRSISATPAFSSESASRVDEPLEQSLPLAACRDDLLGFPVIDPLIFERSRYVICDAADVRLQVKRGGDEMHRLRLERFVGDMTRYVVEKAPCRVILTAAPAGEEGVREGVAP